MIRGSWRPVLRGLVRVAPRLRPSLAATGLASFVRASAHTRPDAIAWLDANDSVTYAELWNRVRAPLCGRFVAQLDDQFDLATMVLRCQQGGGDLVLVPQRAGTLAFDRALAGLPGATAIRSLADLPAARRQRGRGRMHLMTSGSTGVPLPHALRTGLASVPLMLGLLGSLPVPNRPRVGCLTRIDQGHGLALFAATLALGGSFAVNLPVDGLDVLSGIPAQLTDGPPVRPALVISGSDRLGPEQARRIAAAYGCPVVDAYGATEIGTIALDGRLMPGVRARVVDAVGQPLPDGMEGTLEIHSPLRREPFVLDRGYITDARIHVTGRVTDTVLRAGENLSQALLLAWAHDQPDLTDPVLTAMLDARYGVRLRLQLTTTTTEATLRDRIRQTLGAAYASTHLDLRGAVD